jgi:hypothetical protein
MIAASNNGKRGKCMFLFSLNSMEGTNPSDFLKKFLSKQKILRVDIY